MTKVDKQAVVAVLNSLEIIEQEGGESAYILVENNQQNQDALNAVGVSNETINKYGDDETFCILTLGFSEGYVDMYDGGRLVAFDERIDFTYHEEGEEEKTITLFKSRGVAEIAVCIGIYSYSMTLSDEQKEIIKRIVA